jgi:hypothetical protein
MTDLPTEVSTVEYKVVLVVPSSKMIFAIPDRNAFRLPRVHIPKWTRPAEEITRELRENWNLNTVVLNLLPNVDSRPACAVVEVMDTQITGGDPAFCLSSVEKIDRTDLDLGEQDHVSGVLAGSHKPAGPFSRPGWLKEAQNWIQESLSPHHIDFTQEIRQYNAGDTFALVRFGTNNGQAYWLKATGEPNKHEFAITIALSEMFPDYLPPLIARRGDWNAWVTEDAGAPLGCVEDLHILIQAVEALAELQILSLDHISRLEQVGCMDRKLRTVQSHLPEMVAFLEEAMSNQTSTKVKPLAPSRLREIGVILDQAFSEMNNLSIPDSLINGDINLDNVLYRGSFRFTDWAEAGIGNPFLMFQQVIQYVIREGDHLGWVSTLQAAYKRKWAGVLTEPQIDGAFVFMPLLTMISYLFGRGDWLGSPRQGDPSFQSFARTLGRSMDLAARELIPVEALQL